MPFRLYTHVPNPTDRCFMLQKRAQLAAAVLDGRIYVIGGRDDAGAMMHDAGAMMHDAPTMTSLPLPTCDDMGSPWGAT